MTKFLAYVVAAAILVVTGYNTYEILTGKADLSTIVETCAVYAVILTLAIAFFVKAVGKIRLRLRKPKADPEQDAFDELSGKLDTLSDETDSFKEEFQETAEDIKEKLSDLNDKVADMPPAPDAFIPVVNTRDADGKVVPLYELPPEDTIEKARQAYSQSVLARTLENNPVQNPCLTVKEIYY